MRKAPKIKKYKDGGDTGPKKVDLTKWSPELADQARKYALESETNPLKTGGQSNHVFGGYGTLGIDPSTGKQYTDFAQDPSYKLVSGDAGQRIFQSSKPVPYGKNDVANPAYPNGMPVTYIETTDKTGNRQLAQYPTSTYNPSPQVQVNDPMKMNKIAPSVLNAGTYQQDYNNQKVTPQVNQTQTKPSWLTGNTAPANVQNYGNGGEIKRPVFTGNPNYQTFQYPDSKGQYIESVSKNFDTKTGKEIDVSKSFDASGKYVPVYIGGQSVKINRNIDEGARIMDEEVKAAQDYLKNKGVVLNSGTGAKSDKPSFLTGNAVDSIVYNYNKGGLVKKLALGGLVDNGKLTQQGQSATNAAGQIANMGGQYLQSKAIGDDGTVNVNQAAGAGALKGAGQGAQLGTMIAPGIGTAIGAGAGALLGGASSYLGAKNLNEDIAFGKTQAENDKLRMQQENTYNQGLAKQLLDRQTGYAKGGEIKGKGGPKDDKIKATVKPGSFITPAENADKAKQLKKAIAPKKKDNEAELNQEGGVEVRLSDGEYMFTPEEKDKIVKHFGAEILEMLAPNAEMSDDDYDEIEETHMANGGLTPAKAYQMLKDGTAHGKPLTPAQRRYFGYVYGSQGKAEGGEIEIKPAHKGMFTAWAKEHGMSVSEAASHVMANKDKYSPHTVKMANFANNFTGKCMGGMVKKMATGGEVENNYSFESPEEKKYKAAQKRYAELQQEESQLSASKDKAAKSRLMDVRLERTALDKEYGFNNKSNKNIPSKSGAEIEKALGNGPLSSKSKVGAKTTSEYLPSKTTNLVTNTVDEQLKPSGQETITDTTTETPVKKGNNFDWNKASGIASQVAGLGNYFIPYKQYQMGQKYLAQTGPRPKGQIDPDFLKSVQTAQANAKFGMTPEEQSMLNQQNISALRAGQNAAQNYSGGSSSTAYNLTRDAANQYYSRGLAAKLADKNLMFNKQQYADSLNASKANMNRQLFEDNLNAWQQQQAAGGNLVGAGIQNLIGANRLNQEMNFQRQYAQNSNPWTKDYTNGLGT